MGYPSDSSSLSSRTKIHNFRKKHNFIKNAKVESALKHPKWKMGKKISIDSSTMMNKIFELIEAQKLFNIPKDKIDSKLKLPLVENAFIRSHI